MWASLEVDEFRGGRVRDFERFGHGGVSDVGEFWMWASLEVDEFRGGRVRDFERFGHGGVSDVGEFGG